MNYPAASRRGISWSYSDIYDFHCNNLFDRSKLRGIDPKVIQARTGEVQQDFTGILVKSEMNGYSITVDFKGKGFYSSCTTMWRGLSPS